MKIDGKAIAETMLSGLAGQVSELKKLGVTPTMAVILVGNDPASLSYIKQKQNAAEKIGAKLIVKTLDSGLRTQELKTIIEDFNTDPSIHGIIIQRPLPKETKIDTAILNGVGPRKDVDGFVPGSPYTVPVAGAVLTILKHIISQPPNTNPQIPLREASDHDEADKQFEKWLMSKTIVVIGRGETAGSPIADLLLKKGCNVTVVHSQTKTPDKITKTADIIISCVGKENVVRRENMKKDAVLLSVGIWRDDKGKLHGDYNEEGITDIARFYTPTPGGVGPVNVACLMQNLVLAAQKTT